MDRSTDIDPETHTRRVLVKSVRWTNIGFSKTPVNPAVPQVSTVPFGVLAKCWSAAGFNLTKSEGLTAGYGTDSATLEGGGALRKQSLDRKIQSYWDFRDRMAGDIRRGRCGQTAAHLTDHAAGQYGVPRSQAADWSGRFLADLRDGIKQRKRNT